MPDGEVSSEMLEELAKSGRNVSLIMHKNEKPYEGRIFPDGSGRYEMIAQLSETCIGEIKPLSAQSLRLDGSTFFLHESESVRVEFSHEGSECTGMHYAALKKKLDEPAR